MTIRSPFRPHYTTGINVSPAVASASSTLSKGDKSLRVRNTGATNIMYFRTGEGATTATAADMPVSPGETVIVEKPMDHDTVAYISAVGTTATIIPGEGGA